MLGLGEVSYSICGLENSGTQSIKYSIFLLVFLEYYDFLPMATSCSSSFSNLVLEIGLNSVL
jgi:hypothetical protein